MRTISVVLMILFISSVSFFSHGKERISLDFSYDISHQNQSKGKTVVSNGETISKEFGRGDIDTIITMTPVIENRKKGGESIVVEVGIQNFREGDLISEAKPQIVTLKGPTKSLSIKDDILDEKLNISIRANVVQ